MSRTKKEMPTEYPFYEVDISDSTRNQFSQQFSRLKGNHGLQCHGISFQLADDPYYLFVFISEWSIERVEDWLIKHNVDFIKVRESNRKTIRKREQATDFDLTKWRHVEKPTAGVFHHEQV